MNFRFIMVAICGIRMVLTLAIQTTMMISRNYLIMKTPRIFFRNEWLGSCEHALDGSYFAVPEVVNAGKASSPVSGYTPGIDVEVSVTPVRLQH